MSESSSTIGIGGLNLSKDELTSSAFDVFAPIEIEASIKKANKIIARPIASTNSRGPFKFVIPSDPEKWTDCESVRLSGRVKIQKNDGGILSNFSAGNNEVSTVNNFFQSLFSSVECSINGVEVTDPSGNWYPYKSYLETIFSYSKSTKEGRLQSQCFFTDDVNQFDSIGEINAQGQTTKQSDNSGYKKRKEFFKNSEERYFNIPIHSDLCTLRKYLPPNTKLEFEFHRSSDAFSLLTPNADCNIIIEDIALSLSRYTPSNQIKKFHNDKLSSVKKQVLPIDRSLIKTYT